MFAHIDISTDDASVLECVAIPRYDCTDKHSSSTYRTVTDYAWLPVEGTLAGHAAFTPNELEPGLFEFENTSERYAGGVTWEWSFGDGGTSTAQSPIHRYTDPGEYTVRLTMRGTANGFSTSATREVEVEVPELQVSVFNPDAKFGEGESGNRYSLNDEFTAKIVVSATSGVGELTNVRPSSELLTLPPQLEAVDELPTIEPITLAADQKQEYEVVVRAIEPGRFDLDSTWAADDPDDVAVDPVTGTLPGAVTGLAVEITVDPDPLDVDQDNNEDGEVTDEDNDLEIKVKVTNVANDPITGITYDELDLSSNLPRDPEVRLELQTSPALPFDDLDPGESSELVWTYRATDAVDARAQILVTGTINGFETTTNGEGDVVAITERLLEGSITLDNQQRVSGKPIRISATFKNVTDVGEDPKTVTFAIERAFTPGPTALPQNETKPNGGNGWFTLAGSATASGLEIFELAPGAEVELDAIVETIESPEASGFTVEYTVYPYVPKEDSEGNQIEPLQFERADPRNVVISDEDGSSEKHRVSLDKVVPQTDAWTFLPCPDYPGFLGFADYTSCKFLNGVATAGRGLWEIGVLGYHIQVATAQGLIWTYRTYIEMLTSDAATRNAMIEEIVADLIVLKQRGHEALASIKLEDIENAVTGAIDRTVNRISGVLKTGNIKLIVGEMAEIAGENVDMLLEGLVAAKVAIKSSLALGGRTGLLRSTIRNAVEEKSEDAIQNALRVIREQGERALPASRVLPAGVDVTDYPAIAKAWGASPDDVKALFEIAESQGVTIVFRSRSPKSIELIADGSALGKPQGVKTKGVSEMDIEYLGYPESLDSVVASWNHRSPRSRTSRATSTITRS